MISHLLFPNFSYVQQLVLFFMTIGLHVIITYVNIFNQTCSKSKIIFLFKDC